MLRYNLMVLGALAVTAVRAAWSDVCVNGTLGQFSYLSASCPDKNGQFIRSWVKLDKWVGSNNGTLKVGSIFS